MKPTVFIVGGHATPAIAVIEEIKRRKLPVNIIFIGRKYALEGNTSPSFEHQEVVKLGIPFWPLTTGRVSRVFTRFAFWSILKIPLGFLQAFWYILLGRPKLIISFGGYVAVPVAVAGAFWGVSVVTHEQTMTVGLANRIIGSFAKKIFVSFPTKVSKKVVITGLPLRQALFHPPKKPSFTIDTKKPVLYITGGSTGARSLDEKLSPIIKDLQKTWTIIHQSAERTFGVSDVAWIYKHADLVIGRAGANTVAELATLAKPAILIPLPWSGGGEQEKNAQWLAATGAAIVLSQENITKKKLLETINIFLKRKKELREASETLKRQLPRDGAKRMVDEIAPLVLA